MSFDAPGTDGTFAEAGLISDAAGDLFGEMAPGGTNGAGTVFELVNNGSGSYTPVTLVNFNGADGRYPYGGLIADAAGDLFGTTTAGGASGDGSVFELVKNGGENYTLNTLASFNVASYPSGLIANSAGDLFGEHKRVGPTTMAQCSNW